MTRAVPSCGISTRLSPSPSDSTLTTRRLSDPTSSSPRALKGEFDGVGVSRGRGRRVLSGFCCIDIEVDTLKGGALKLEDSSTNLLVEEKEVKRFCHTIRDVFRRTKNVMDARVKGTSVFCHFSVQEPLPV
jgi:hypothetical protein